MSFPGFKTQVNKRGRLFTTWERPHYWALFFVFFFVTSTFARPVNAGEPVLFSFDDSIAVSGKTVTASGARFGFRAGIASAPFSFTVTAEPALPAPMPAGWTAASAIVTYATTNPDGSATALSKPLWVAIPYSSRSSLRVTTLFRLSAQRNRWIELSSGADRQAGEVRAGLEASAGTIVVGESDTAHTGVASWYRSSRYPYGAAFNEAPIGAKLLVTNLENNRRVQVTVVSRGPFVDGRVVDLTNRAFETIGRRGAGLARVKVKVLTPAVAGSAITRLGQPPTVQSNAFTVYSPTEEIFLAEQNAEQPRPIASLTKLLTASVVLDLETPFSKIVTYQSGDNAIGSRLRISPGETVSVGDLFSTALIGSANNATNALVRATGLSRKEFVKRMNEKAIAWGLETASFTDPTGLDPTNVASARDAARLTAKAFADPRIAAVSRKAAYTFTTRNTKVSHTVKNRNLLVGAVSGLVGTKTGFLDEAGYCLVALVKHDGKEFVVAILGSATDRSRYDETNALIAWVQ